MHPDFEVYPIDNRLPKEKRRNFIKDRKITCIVKETTKSTWSIQLAVFSFVMAFLMIPFPGLPHVNSVALRAIIFLLAVLSIIVWSFEKRGIGALSKKSRVILFIWLMLLTVMFINGFVRSMPYNREMLLRSLSNDLLTVSYFTLGFVFASYKSRNDFVNIIKYLGPVAVIVGFYAVITGSDFHPSYHAIKMSAWSLPYYLWWMVGALYFCAIFQAIFQKKNVWIGWTLLFLYVTCGLMFLKRVVLFELLLIVLIVLIQIPIERPMFLKINKLSRTRRKSPILLMLLLFCLILVVAITPTYYLKLASFVRNIDVLSGVVVDRFKQTQEDLPSFDRFIELSSHLESVDTVSAIVGMGFGVFQYYIDIENPNLHMGWGNIFYKGGLILLLFYIYLFIMTIKVFLRRNKSPVLLVSSSISIFYFISLIFSAYWTHIPYTVIFGTMIITTIDQTSEVKRGKT